ncbi:MAG: mechanosensitive ion channel family protein [Thermoplasmatota archaeon]
MELVESFGWTQPSEFLTFLINIGLWVGAALLLHLVIAPVLTKIASKTPLESDDKIVRIITFPIFLLVVLFGAIQSIGLASPNPAVTNVLDALWGIAVVIAVTIMVYRVWHEVFRDIGRIVSRKTTSSLDDKLFPLFDKMGGVVIFAVGAWFLGAALGLDMTLFAAGGAVGGLVIAFAAQDTLGNLFAGIFILADQPFKEGDRIEIKEENTWGDVVEIGLRSTKIRTRDNRLVVVPNRIMGNNPVVNHSVPSTEYRTETHVGIAYGSDIERARTAMVEAVASVPGVDADRPVEALFVEFGDSALNFRLRWWIPNYMDTRRMFDKVHTAVEKRLREENIEIPFPQRVVTMVQG